jgi:hypothetical protein
MAADSATLPQPAIFPQSRRALLSAGVGGLLALIAQAIARPLAARAADGDPVLVGGTHEGTQTTMITNTNGGTAFFAETTGPNDLFVAAIIGKGDEGIGVEGTSEHGQGVSARSTSGAGLIALSQDGAGVRATSINATGVYGSGGGGPSAAPARTGVFGYAEEGATSNGVWGRTSVGRGVRGTATTGVGVLAEATLTGTALRTNGPVRFSSAGLATIVSGSRSVVVNPGLDITGSSKILALPQTNPGGATTVQRVFRDTTANTFTLWLTANATANTTVAWFVIS